jgi:hypothetical protein
MQYFTEADYNSAVEWLYPGGQLDFSATILWCNNASVDRWNAIAQGMNPSELKRVSPLNYHVDGRTGRSVHRLSITEISEF